MNDQLLLGHEYISEKDIIRAHYKRLASKGGSTITEKKQAAARRNIKLAQAARVLKGRKAGKT